MTLAKTAAFASIAAMTVALTIAQVEQQEVLPMGTLSSAIQAIEEESGGKLLEIRLMDEKGEPAFEAAVAQGDSIVYLRVASVGDVVTHISVRELPPWLQNYKMQAYMQSASRAKVPLAEAVLKAEAKAEAPAIGAGIAKPLGGSNAVLAYYVETLKGGKRQLLAVDAESGAMIANPEEVYEHWTPVRLARRLAP
jgi:uncharacterized membrane protein YkoI